jgi:uncharacterized SAM-binding protein YcdF (DUF218 family)
LPRWRWIISIVVTGAVVAVLLGRSLWLPLVGDFLIVADPLQQADALVALGGGGERVVYAAKLFNQGYADWLIATNMELNVPGIRESYSELVKREAIWQRVPEENILIAPGTAETTYEEALAVRQLVEERGLRSLIVVTDPYHTRRARMAFRDVFRGTGIEIIVRPVNEHWYKPDSWWKSRDGLRETWTEYLKLILYVVGYR